MSPVLLDVNGLTTRFATRAGSLNAVEDVSFTVAEGEIVGLVGESGSGKSVTGFSILGLIDPPGRIVSGSVKLNGRELVGLSHAAALDARARDRHGVSGPLGHAQPVLTIETQMRLAIAAMRTLATRRHAPAASRFWVRSASPMLPGASRPIPTSSPAACASASPLPSPCSTVRS
jgi:peptide/nickel transport system ATP-binding protein